MCVWIYIYIPDSIVSINIKYIYDFCVCIEQLIIIKIVFISKKYFKKLCYAIFSITFESLLDVEEILQPFDKEFSWKLLHYTLQDVTVTVIL